jgi:hypothetical protein
MHAHRLESLEQRRLMSTTTLWLQGQQTITPGLTVDASSDNSFGQSGMAIDVNPRNPLDLAGVTQHVGGMNEIDIYRSFDGGNTWAKTAIDNGTVGFNDGTGAGTRFDPTIAFDDNGNLFVAYGNDIGSSTKAVLARSTDGGATFGQFRTIATTADIYNGTAIEVRGNAQFSLATGPDGLGGQALYLAYINSAIETGLGLDQRITLIASNDAGSNFQTSQIVNNASVSGADSYNYSPDVAVGPAGQAYVVWHNANLETGAERLMFDRDLDGRFGSSSNFGLDSTLKNFGSGGSLIGWSVPASPDHGVYTSPSIVVDRSPGAYSGGIYISYCDWVSGSNCDIKVLRSPNGTGTWSEVTVESSPGTDFNPQLSIDQHSGAVALAYYSTKSDVATGNDDVQPFVALSITGGASFTSNVVSSQTSNESGGYAGDYGDHVGIAVRDGTAHVFWSSRHGAGTDLDAFTATVGFDNADGYNYPVINADSTNDAIVLHRSPINSSYVEVLINGTPAFLGLWSILGQMNLYGGDGNDQISIDSLPANMTFYVDGGAGDDQLSVASVTTGDHLWVGGGAGNDSFNVGAGNIDHIDGELDIVGDVGVDSLTIDDSQHATNNSILISNQAISGPESEVIPYWDIQNITITTGTGNGAGVQVDSSDANLTIHGNGHCPIGVGSSYLDGVTGAVSVDHAGVVGVADYYTSTDNTFTVTASTITRPGFGGLTYSDCHSVDLFCGTGNDTINVNSTFAGSRYFLSGRGGNDVMNVNETDPAAPVEIPNSSVGDDTVNVNMDNAGSATVKAWSSVLVPHLNIGNGGLFSLYQGANNVLTVHTLNIPGSGRLDLNDNDMIVDYTGASPMANIQALLTSGYFASGWTGAGIDSTTAANNPSRDTALGFGEAAQLGYSTFDGQEVDSTAILIKYTRYGDANLDGKVDTLDFNALAGNFGGSNRNWTQADFNFDKIIDTLDFNMLAANFGKTAPAATAAQVVPASPLPIPLAVSSIFSADPIAREVFA